jgi:hypothetical protein
VHQAAIGEDGGVARKRGNGELRCEVHFVYFAIGVERHDSSE